VRGRRVLTPVRGRAGPGVSPPGARPWPGMLARSRPHQSVLIARRIHATREEPWKAW